MKYYGEKLKHLPIADLELIKVLDRYDGCALISHYRSSKGNNYLNYWCDSNETVTRWMLIKISEIDLFRIINQLVPLDTVIPFGGLDDFVYIIDADDKGRQTIYMVQCDDVPKEYRPKTVYLEPLDQTNQYEFAIMLERPQSTITSSNRSVFSLPKLFSQVYSALYTIEILKPKNYEQIPYRDGLHGKRFFDWAVSQVPGEDKDEVVAFQFASPGMIKLSLNRRIADIVTTAISCMVLKERAINKVCRNLYDFISDKKLNALYDEGVGKSQSDEWEKHNPRLKKLTNNLMTLLQIPSPESFLESIEPFEAAKIFLAIERRLVQLRRYEKEGIARFPKNQ